MKSSYKIALLVAALLCIVVVWYYGNQPSPQEAVGQIKAQPDPTATLLSPPISSPISAPTPSVPPPSASPVPELRLDGSTPPPAVPVRPTSPSSASPPPAASPPAVPPSAAQARTYTVEAGDNFSRIAVKLYGDERFWDELSKANPTVDARTLRVGQVLKLPDQATLDRGQASTEPAAAAPGDTIAYTVQSGDTLSEIAKAYYGDTSQWRYLYSVNRQVIGTSPDALKAGMKLTIPPVPKAAE